MKFDVRDIRTFTPEAYAAACLELDPVKAARLAKTRQRKDRLRTVLADSLARQMLAEALGCTTKDVRFTYGENGKPLLADGELFFSISHSEDLVAVAVADCPVGVDIEKIREVALRPAKKYFSPRERLYLFGHEARDTDYEAVPSPAVLVRFFEIWTAKEACLKAGGEGLSRLRAVDTADLTVERHLLPENYLLTVYFENNA